MMKVGGRTAGATPADKELPNREGGQNQDLPDFTVSDVDPGSIADDFKGGVADVAQFARLMTVSHRELARLQILIDVADKRLPTDDAAAPIGTAR